MRKCLGQHGPADRMSRPFPCRLVSDISVQSLTRVSIPLPPPLPSTQLLHPRLTPAPLPPPPPLFFHSSRFFHFFLDLCSLFFSCLFVLMFSLILVLFSSFFSFRFPFLRPPPSSPRPSLFNVCIQPQDTSSVCTRREPGGWRQAVKFRLRRKPDSQRSKITAQPFFPSMPRQRRTCVLLLLHSQLWGSPYFCEIIAYVTGF